MKQTFVYIHGAMGSAHDLDFVKPIVEAAGHNLVTFDLPAHGMDNTPCKEVQLQHYIDATKKVVEAQDGQVILLAHSFAGITATKVANDLADKVKAVVYICAFVPQDGESMMMLAQQDKESLLGGILQYNVEANEATLPVPSDAAWEVLANDATPEIKTMLAANPPKAEPLSPMGTPVSLTGNIERVKKYYIHTKLDRTISFNFQEWMTGRTKFITQYTLETAHMPFLTQPQQLAEIILKIN